MTLRGYFDVMDYGAKGDGSNDLAALQSAVDAADAAGGGTVWLGPGRFWIGNGTLKIGQANAQHHINLEGINPNTTQILCDTSAGNAAIYLNLEKYVTINNFSIINEGARGGIGLQLGGDAGAGTQTNGNSVEHLFLQNFDKGVSTSGGLGTSSEITFDHCVFQGNNYGFHSANFNGLNYLFLMLEMYSNSIAGFHIEVGNATVIGGASANNKNDFYIAGGNDGQVKIIGFRGEQPTDAWLVAPSNSYLSVEDCIVHPRANGVEVMRLAGDVYVRNCELLGYITWGGAAMTSLTLERVWVVTPGTDWSVGNQYSSATPPFGPGFRLTNNTGLQAEARARIFGVYEGSNNTVYPNGDYIQVVRPSDNMRCMVKV